MADADPNWEGGCLSAPPEILPANSFAWYILQRCVTQWNYSQFSGEKLALKYEVVAECIKEGGFRGFDFFDQLERVQQLELAILSQESSAREIERETAENREAFEKRMGALDAKG